MAIVIISHFYFYNWNALNGDNKTKHTCADKTFFDKTWMYELNCLAVVSLTGNLQKHFMVKNDGTILRIEDYVIWLSVGIHGKVESLLKPIANKKANECKHDHIYLKQGKIAYLKQIKTKFSQKSFLCHTKKCLRKNR